MYIGGYYIIEKLAKNGLIVGIKKYLKQHVKTIKMEGFMIKIII